MARETTAVPNVVAFSSNRKPHDAEKCKSREAWGTPADRALCASLLPVSVVEHSEWWLVGVHVDRAPTAILDGSNLRGGRNVAPHRELPHQYFVGAVEAALRAISTVEPGASVDLVVFSEGKWGRMVDEMGVPVTWDIQREVCEGVGLNCTQVIK